MAGAGSHRVMPSRRSELARPAANLPAPLGAPGCETCCSAVLCSLLRISFLVSYLSSPVYFLLSTRGARPTNKKSSGPLGCSRIPARTPPGNQRAQEASRMARRRPEAASRAQDGRRLSQEASIFPRKAPRRPRDSKQHGKQFAIHFSFAGPMDLQRWVRDGPQSPRG